MPFSFRLTVIPLIFISLFPVSAQEFLAEHKIQLTEFESSLVLPVVEQDGDIRIFVFSNHISDSQGISELFYDHIKGELSVRNHEKPEATSFKNIAGYSLLPDNVVALYLHRPGRKLFDRILLSESGSTWDQIQVNTKKEQVLTYFTREGRFSMLTVKRNSSILNYYTFQGDQVEVKRFDLTGERFFDRENQLKALSEIFNLYPLQVIQSGLSSAPSEYTQRAKLYPSEKELFITLNTVPMGTRTIALHLEQGTSQTGFVPMPTMEFQTAEKIVANSYYFKDRMYSMIATKNKMILTVHDGTGKEKIQSLHLKKDDPAVYATDTPGESEVEESQPQTNSRMLKKIVKGVFAGLAVEQYGERKTIKIGTYAAGSGGFYMPGGTGGGTVATPYGNVTIAGVSPTYFSFDATGYGSFYEKQLIIDGNPPEFLADVPRKKTLREWVRQYENERKRIRLQTFFQYGSNGIYGYYNAKDDLYSLVQFKL